jgi:hypothetical protein
MSKLAKILRDQTGELRKHLEDPNVTCRKCQTQQIVRIEAFELGTAGHRIKAFNCLRCNQLNVEMITTRAHKSPGSPAILTFSTALHYPTAARQFRLPSDLPQNISADYEECAKLLPVSPAASAAFARRCLQTILTSRGYLKTKLVLQINDLINETEPSKIVPHYITTRIDAVRNFGNFSAHEVSDRATAEILDVQPGEAEWCLEILEDLIEHYFVRPEFEKAKVDRLNEKLRGAGKPEIKIPPTSHTDSNNT